MKILSLARNKIIAAILVLGVATVPVVLAPSPTLAAPSCTGTDCVTTGAKKSGIDDNVTVDGTIKNVTNVLLFLIGAVSVIMLIVGGFRYVASNGNADQIKAAKNTIMYAIIGLVVAIVAYAIVEFVADAIIGS